MLGAHRFSGIIPGNKGGGGGGGGTIPPQGGNDGKVLYTNGTNTFWGDQTLMLFGNDANWVNGTDWVNGSSYINESFEAPFFTLFYNDASRYLLQPSGEWQYITNGFRVLLGSFDGPVQNAVMVLIFKGTP